VIDEAGLIRFANASAATALGYGHASDLLGKPSHQTMHHKRPDGTACPVQECRLLLLHTTGQELHAEDYLVRRDGSLLPVEFWSAPIDLPDGRGAVVCFSDVSERQRTERALADRGATEQAAVEREVAEARAAELTASEARLRAILEAAHDGVLSIDQHARITYANTSAERMFGYRADELTGQEIAEVIVPPSLREAHRAGFSRYMTTGESHILDRQIEVTALRADGTEFPVELTITRAGLPGSPAFIGWVRDITDRKHAAQELIASRARLVTASDAARQRVTRDLHDGAQQRLVSAIIGLQLAQRKWESEPRRARELVDLALNDATHGMAELRELAAGIHPAILTQRGLAAALAGLTGRLPVPVQLDLPRHRLPAPIEASVYFFCAEALTNVVKHARASSAWVKVTADDERCTVEVRDDGIGGARARSDSSGLTGLRDRIGALNGIMDIVAPAEGGTVLRAAIPLPGTSAGEAGPTP
jgi:PAS domain S-box-containing protein